MLKIFCSYSHRDRELKESLEAHLATLIIAGKVSIVWSDEQITAGTKFEPRIRTELQQAEIILLLLSADYFKSVYCWQVEARAVLALHDQGKTKGHSHIDSAMRVEHY